MALNSEITVRSGQNFIPSGYTVPTTTITFSGSPFVETVENDFTASATDDASNDVTGFTALVAAVKSWVDATLIPTDMKVDITGQTVNAIITIVSVDRFRDPSTLFVTGVEKYRVKIVLQYE